ncbi:MAG: hypothetical protein RLZZ618_3065 [Pseudomonadota bacterium]|jgi:diadenosine tetraphosphate (Ap4A) HIT family hydrolase
MGLPTGQPGCELCAQAGGELVFAADEWRVIRVVDADFPGFYRVVWNAHVAEFTDLAADARVRCMAVVACVESVLRASLLPTKVNLAALGNMVPHLHWHVIARFDWDSHFPQPVWGVRQREVAPAAVDRLPMSLVALDETLRTALKAV